MAHRHLSGPPDATIEKTREPSPEYEHHYSREYHYHAKHRLSHSFTSHLLGMITNEAHPTADELGAPAHLLVKPPQEVRGLGLPAHGVGVPELHVFAARRVQPYERRPQLRHPQ